MKRINPKTNVPYKWGDVREDGWIFEAYKPSVLRKSGFFKESWQSLENFENNKNRKNKMLQDTRIKNPEKYKAYSKKHAKDNPSQYAAKTAKRRSAKLNRTPKWLTADDIEHMQALYSVAAMIQRESGVEYHIDHIIPLQGKFVSGLHVPDNLRVIPAVDNLKKSNKHTL